jgi:hypothetical protein
MALPAYPATPKPTAVYDLSLDARQAETDVEGQIRHVRTVRTPRLRRMRIAYEGVSAAEAASLAAFWIARRAGTDRFSLAHPDPNEAGVSFPAAFEDAVLDVRQNGHESFSLAWTVAEAP